jgi:predicted permease
MRHVKHAIRTLVKTPFVTGVAIASLALGIGANAAIFSLFNEILLRPLPVSSPGQLVMLSAPGPKPGSTSCDQSGSCDDVFSYPMLRDLQRQQTALSHLVGFRTFGANLAARGQTLNGDGILVSGSYFPALGLNPVVGRLLGPEDDKVAGDGRVAVLSHAYWESRFGSEAGVLGQPLVVNGQTLTIVGVAPRGFKGTTLGVQPSVFVPITLRELMIPGPANPQGNSFENRRMYWIYLFGRLTPGVTMAQASSSLNGPYQALLNEVEAPLQIGMSDATLARFRARHIVVSPGSHGQSQTQRESRAPLTLLFGVTALVLIIACANIANLLLARSAARAGEMAVRLSIGASRRQLVTQLLIEACTLSVLGGLAGLVAARWTLDLIGSLLPAEATQSLQMRLDPEVLLFTMALSLGTGVLFGLFPALHSTRPDLVATLKSQAGQPSGSRGAARFRTTLATAQIALSMALLIAAGLFTKSLLNVSRVDLGLRSEDVITFRVSPSLNGYSTERTLALLERLEDDLSALPGATAVTGALVAMLTGSNWGNDVLVEGFDGGPDTDRNSRFNAVAPDYFQALGIPLLAGREFTRADAAGAPKVAIVNEAFAKKFNLGRDPVGKRMANRRPGQTTLDTEIVGFVKDAKYANVKQATPPLFFQPYRQQPGLGSLTFYVRTGMDPEEFIAGIPRVVAALDPNLPVENLRTLPQQIRENVFLDRMLSVLSAGFAGIATVLAAIGLYGVLAYTVAQRTREIGLRMALGAAPGRVRAMVLRQVGLMTIVGGIVGLAASVLLSRLAQSLLYELGGTDPAVLVASVTALTLVSLAAGLVPAHRAASVEPMQALRYE